MDRAKYRGLRGLVRHGYKKDGHIPRVLIPWSVLKATDGVCTWCGWPPDEPRRKRWHSSCYAWALTATGGIPYQSVWDAEVTKYSCAVCKQECGMGELDHTLAISVGQAMGGRWTLRAFTPMNIRRLCHSCHVAKTKSDRAVLKMLKT